MKLRELIRILTTPSCWLRNYPYSPELDRQLNELMDKHTFVPLGAHRAQLGPIVLWTANHPYASFHIMFNDLTSMRLMPSRATVFRAHDKYLHDLVQYNMAMGA